MTIKVAVYDDNVARRESLKLLIDMQSDMQCCGLYKNCLHILDDISLEKPNVILMDIDMPGMSGIQGVKSLRSVHEDIFIIMQTVFDDAEKIFAAIRAGADGYFLKKTHSEKLIAGIREVMDGGAPMTASVARQVLFHFQNQTEKDSSEFNLSEKERSILQHLVNGESYKMIAGSTNLTYSAVNMYIKKIYKKLHVHSATEAVSKAIQERIV